MAYILVIEDEHLEREILCRQLAQEGHDVAEAPDGNIGLAEYREHGADLIITDIFMPELDGISTILKLREESYYGPIIAISGGGQVGFGSDYLNVARLVGADAALAKPLDGVSLVRTVSSLLNERIRT